MQPADYGGKWSKYQFRGIENRGEEKTKTSEDRRGWGSTFSAGCSQINLLKVGVHMVKIQAVTAEFGA